MYLYCTRSNKVFVFVCVRRLLRREICCLQHGETESNVWNTFVWSCPTWPSRWGMRISIDWPRLKSCQAVCDECMRGEIYSSLSRDAGCSAMWTWRGSRVTKIWGSGHDHGFVLFLPPSWRHAHAHFGFAYRQQPLRWLKPFLKHWYGKLYELIAPHTLKWINSVIKLGHFVWNIIYCFSRIKFKDRWVVFFIYDSFCWTKSPTAASLGSRNDAM